MSKNDASPEGRVAKWIGEGDTLLGLEAWEEAVASYEKALAEAPENVHALFHQGVAQFRLRRIDEAERLFKQALAVDPEFLAAYFNLGMLYEERGDFQGALSFYKEVVTRQDRDMEAYVRMGHCAQALGRPEDALQFWEEVLRMAPHHPEAGNLVAAIYIERGEWARAEDALRVSLVSHPEEKELHFVLGLVLKEQQKWEAALAAFNKVVTLDKSHDQGFYHLGEVCLALDLVKQAEPFFAKAFKINPGNLDALRLLGRVYEMRKDAKSAVVMYSQWVERIDSVGSAESPAIRDQYRAICEFLAKYFEKKGDPSRAAEYQNRIRTPEADDFRVSLQ